MITSVNGDIVNAVDPSVQRVAAGTIGGTQMIAGGVSSQTMSSIIFPTDTRVSTRGTWSFSSFSGVPATDYLGASVFSSTPSSRIMVRFTGTRIAMLGQIGPSGGTSSVTIDGNPTVGKVNTYTGVSTSYVDGNGGGMNATTTTINVGRDPIATGFIAPGQAQVDREQFSYTGMTTTSFTGVTRGINSTVAAQHQPNSPVYAISSVVNSSSSVYMDRVRLWSVDNLTPGPHLLTLTVTSGLLYVNGFTLGGVLGASNINTYMDFFNLGSAVISSFGYGPIQSMPGAFTSDRQLLALLPGSCDQTSAVFPIINNNASAEGISPTTLRFLLYAPTNTSTTITNVIIPCLMLGPSF